MTADKTIGHILIKRTIVHTTQIIMSQDIHEFIIAVSVIAGIFFVYPKITPDFISYILSLPVPDTFLPVLENMGNIGKHGSRLAGIGTDVHGFIRELSASFRSVFTSEAAVLYPIFGKTQRIILTGIPGTPAFQTAVSVAVAVSP